VKKIKSRDMRDSSWRALGRWVIKKDWKHVLEAQTYEDKYNTMMTEINTAMNTFLPMRTVKKHPTDHPWITCKIKFWISKRQTAFLQQGKDSAIFKYWRNKVQREIKAAKYHYYKHKVADVENTKPRTWWKNIKNLSGLTAQSEWYHQFLDDNNNNKALADKIINFFVSITDHFQPIMHPGPHHVPQDFYTTVDEVSRSLSSLNTTKAIGPDNLPTTLLKEFATERTPVIIDIYNQSLKEGSIPSLLKSSIVTPVPKVNPPSNIESD